MTHPIPPKIAHAAHRAMLAMHREPIRDEDVERLRRLTVEAGDHLLERL